MNTKQARGNPLSKGFRTLDPKAASLLGIPTDWKIRRGVRTLILVGPNSSGKSLLMRHLMSSAKGLGFQPAFLSMALRTQGGIGGSMVYGLGESCFGTGCNSAIAVMGMLNNLQNWKGEHLVGFDEPDIGLSDEYALDMAERIADAILSPAPAHSGTIVASHSRVLLERLTGRLDENGHRYDFLALGNPEITSAAEWFNRPVERKSLEELQETNITRFRAISALMDKKKRDR